MPDHNAELAVRMADDWLEKNRKTDTWRLVNMLRDELVRSQDRVGSESVPEITPHALIIGSTKRRDVLTEARQWQMNLLSGELTFALYEVDDKQLVTSYLKWWNVYTNSIQEATSNHGGRGVSEEDTTEAHAKANAAVIALLS